MSLTTVDDLALTAGGTHICLLTEQVAFLDGSDNAANREEGLASMLDRIGPP